MDVRGLTLTALRRNIGVVLQEALLFNRSIADNLRIGKPDATEEEMQIAAARAQALDFIERSDLKFDTSAGERGRMAVRRKQRQRLSIARCAAEGSADPDLSMRRPCAPRRRHRSPRSTPRSTR